MARVRPKSRTMNTKEPLAAAPPRGYGTTKGVSVAVPDADTSLMTPLEQQDLAAERKQAETMLNMLGPPFARTHAFWLAMLAAVLMGVVMSLVSLFMFNFFDKLGELTWYDEEYSEGLKEGAANGQIGRGHWWWLWVTSGGGLVIGLVKVLWSYLIAPYPLSPPTILTEVQDLHAHRPTETIATLMISAISIGCGASVGPEAALGGVGGALGTVFGRAGHPLYRKAKELFASMHHHDAAPTEACDDALVPQRLIPLYTLTGMAAAFGPLLPSPFLSTLLLHELSIVGGTKNPYGQFRCAAVTRSTAVGFTPLNPNESK
eukprot:5188918-Prymnesium_polylepis.1